MSDKTECPNGCGAEVRALWIHPPGSSWDGPDGLRPYRIASRTDFHTNNVCPGSYESGAAVAFGLLGMAKGIRQSDDQDDRVRFLQAEVSRLEDLLLECGAILCDGSRGFWFRRAEALLDRLGAMGRPPACGKHYASPGLAGSTRLLSCGLPRHHACPCGSTEDRPV
jgi:hypothetical protein